MVHQAPDFLDDERLQLGYVGSELDGKGELQVNGGVFCIAMSVGRPR